MENAISILVAGNATAHKNGTKLINVTNFVKAIYVSTTSTKLITNDALDEVTITHAAVSANSGAFQDLVQDAVEKAYHAPGS